jgi:hypothetical protein
MSRLRSTLSQHPVDKIILRKVDDARRMVLEALHLCESTSRKEPTLRTRKTRDDLLRLLQLMGSVHRVQPMVVEEEKPRERPVKDGPPSVLEESEDETV